MGLNISDLFGSSASTAEQGMSDALKSGANAALGFLEKNAIDLISKDKAQHEAAAQTATKDLLGQPSNPNGFGAYMANLMQGPTLQTYGPYVLAGVALVAILAIFLSKK